MEENKNNNREQSLFEIIKEAQNSPIQQLAVMALDLNKSEHISPLDACTCTGNCESIM